MPENTAKYPLPMRILHWLMAVVILGLIAVGWRMTDLPKEDELRPLIYGLHKSFGVLALILVTIRLAVRFKLRARIPALPEALKHWEKTLAHAVHWIIYAFIIAVPLSGYMMSDAGGHGVKMFGIPMPSIFPQSKELGGLGHTLHGILPYILLGLLALHVAGAIKHRLEGREKDVLRRML